MELTAKQFYPDKKYVKPLGRTQFVNDTLWLVSSGTGAEFTFVGTKAVITMLSDSTIWGPEESYARIAIFVDEECVIDDLMDREEKAYTVCETKELKAHTIKVIKLSEAMNSTVGIKHIEVVAEEDICPTFEKEHLIEFIGDSITCGYGVEDEDKEHHFATKIENVMKTCAYKTAVALESDYSMVAYSGHGIVSGYTDNGNRVDEILSPYYTKLGFSYGRYMEMNPCDFEWNFSKREPDLVVINLGTNDENYVRADETRKTEFTDGYVSFLYAVREKNPNAAILCTLGIMTDYLYSCVEKAVEVYKAESGDDKVYSMVFDVQSELDGYAADWHPTEKTYTKAAEKLTTEIRKIMEW